MRVVRLAVQLALCAGAASAQGAPPLEASLRHGLSEPTFYVDQPAYVVVFEVLPGQGVQQIFPRSTWQASRPVDPGEYLLSRPFRSQYGFNGWNASMPYARPMWMVDARGRIISYYYTTGWTGAGAGWGSATIAPTRTLLLVASRTPLRRVASPEGAQHWLQQVAGFRAISNAVVAPQDMLTDIVDAVLPLGSTVDDVVVDVLEVTEDFNARNRYAGRSIAFYCPTGIYNMSAEFFFASGVFFCPVRPYDNAPVSTPGGTPSDSAHPELLLPPRPVKPRYDVDERLVPSRRGVVSTPVAPALVPSPDGLQPEARRVRTEPAEGYRPYGRGIGSTDLGARGAIAIDVPVDRGNARRVAPIPSEAYVPWSPREAQAERLSGARRVNSSGTWAGTEARSSVNAQGSGSTASGGASTGSSGASASQAQAERSAASREAVSAAHAAASKPNPNP